LPYLRAATRNNSLEMTRRAEGCIAEIEKQAQGGLVSAVARLVKVRKPDGACEVLLAYLPFANDEVVEEEVIVALAALGAQQGRIEAPLIDALQDPAPARRAAAALLVGRFGSAEQKKEASRLLTDPEPKVRLRAARGLIAGGDRKAVATVVSLLSGAPLDLAVEAEDMLVSLAGKAAPGAKLTAATDAVRRECRAAWDAWLQANEDKMDLARMNQDLFLDFSARARQTARQNLTALFKMDAATLKKTTDAPFQFVEMERIKTRAELDQGIDLLCQLLQNDPKAAQELAKVTMEVGRVVSAEAYERAGKSGPLKKFLAELPRKAELRVVYVRIKGIQDGLDDSFVVLVRVAGGGARVIGLDVDKDR
jgi:hypothetical protein